MDAMINYGNFSITNTSNMNLMPNNVVGSFYGKDLEVLNKNSTNTDNPIYFDSTIPCSELNLDLSAPGCFNFDKEPENLLSREVEYRNSPSYEGLEALEMDHMELIESKGDGVNAGGIYKDENGVHWLIRDAHEGEHVAKNYITSRFLCHINADTFAETRLIKGSPHLVASRMINNFKSIVETCGGREKMKSGKANCNTRANEIDGKKLEGYEDLTVAINFLGIGDTHLGNLGVINHEKEGLLQASMVDYDFGLGKRLGKKITLPLDKDPAHLNSEHMKNALARVAELSDDEIYSIVFQSAHDLAENGVKMNDEIATSYYNMLIESRERITTFLESTPIIEAVLNDDKDGLISALETASIEPSKAFDYEGNSPLYIARQSGLFSMENILLENGATYSLHESIKLEDLDMLKKGINQGLDVNESFEGKTPLAIVIENNDINAMKILLEGGADVTKRSGAFYPIEIAVQQSSSEAINLLIDHGAPIMDAILEGSLTATVRLIQEGFSLFKNLI